jgi:RNA polymerase sigma-70 factor (ECF subfamily)
LTQASETFAGASVGFRREAELIQRLKARLPEAWAELYDAYYDRLRKYAIARIGSREEAEDIASLAFLRALNGIDSYKSTGRPIIAWLYGIARNLVRELCRRPDRRRVNSNGATDDGMEPYDASHTDPDVAELLDLQTALGALTPRQREVVTLLHFAGFNVREVATLLGKHERSIYYLEARALIRLKDELLAQDEVARADGRTQIATILATGAEPAGARSPSRRRETCRTAKPAAG